MVLHHFIDSAYCRLLFFLPPLKIAFYEKLKQKPGMSKGKHRNYNILHISFGQRKLQNIHMKKLTQCLQDKIQHLIICGISISAINRLCIFFIYHFEI